jgi:hypothetical protein
VNKRIKKVVLIALLIIKAVQASGCTAKNNKGAEENNIEAGQPTETTAGPETGEILAEDKKTADDETTPADPNKKLPCGYTLADIKYRIDFEKEKLTESNEDETLKEEDIIYLDSLAGRYGTLLKELDSLPETSDIKIAQETKDEQKAIEKQADKNNQKQNTDKPSQPVKSAEPAKPSESTKPKSDKKLELETDKWHTKEQKEAARQHAIEHGDKTWEERAKNWENAPDWMKEFSVSPYDIGGDGTIYFDNLDSIDPGERDLYRYREGKGWYYHGRGVAGL